MKYLFLLFIFSQQIAAAQTFSYPKLNKQGIDLSDLVPQNWKAIATAYGDLNNDLTEDMAIVLEYNLPITENRAYGDNETALIKEFQKPRVLAIYIKNKTTGNYTFLTQNNHFILRAQEGGAMGDPFKNISIKNNNLQLAFEGGSNWRWKLNYEFKYQNKDWNLIAANNIYYNIESGEMTEKHYDFLARKVYLTTGSLFNRNAANRVSEEILYFSSLRTFATFKKPWTWEITKDNFL
ncbi:MAG: hypothetical protein V4541_10320 [Bacteroidota bacterium]